MLRSKLTMNSDKIECLLNKYENWLPFSISQHSEINVDCLKYLAKLKKHDDLINHRNNMLYKSRIIYHYNHGYQRCDDDNTMRGNYKIISETCTYFDGFY